MTKKEEIIEALNKIALSNNDCGKYGDGFEKAINEATDVVNKLLIPDISGQDCDHPYEYLSFGEDGYCECERCKTRLN